MIVQVDRKGTQSYIYVFPFLWYCQLCDLVTSTESAPCRQGVLGQPSHHPHLLGLEENGGFLALLISVPRSFLARGGLQVHPLGFWVSNRSFSSGFPPCSNSVVLRLSGKSLGWSQKSVLPGRVLAISPLHFLVSARAQSPASMPCTWPCCGPSSLGPCPH